MALVCPPADFDLHLHVAFACSVMTGDGLYDTLKHQWNNEITFLLIYMKQQKLGDFYIQKKL